MEIRVNDRLASAIDKARTLLVVLTGLTEISKIQRKWKEYVIVQLILDFCEGTFITVFNLVKLI